ncbi:MAG TPA: acyltransferase family protein [Ferruginibacter sp.]|jgi:peptidoglycan/LPS O-acetylase OafA/YrhL|nr:acyltransferase family protein [Ferruginibacter sp.]
MKLDVQRENNNWVNGLDSIRFILALIVLLSHFGNPWVSYFAHFDSGLLKGFGMLIPNLFSGIGAVIAFFIISGFVIHYPNKKGIPDVRKYLLRRWLRIGIPLVVVVIITVHYNCFNCIPIWSLYCELIYYTIYPSLLKTKVNWKFQCIISFMISIGVIGIFCTHDIGSFIQQKAIGGHSDPLAGAYWQLGPYLTWIIGLPCWLLGVLLAENIDAITKTVSVKRILFLRIAVFIISVGLNIAKFHFFVSYIFSMNVFALILFIWIKNEILYYRERKPVSILEKMGVFSYSLYLLHSVCYTALIYFFPLTKLSYFIFIVISICISYLFYLVIEKPSHLFAKKLANKIHTNSVYSVEL